MSETDLPDRSLFAKVEPEPEAESEVEPEEMNSEDEEMILNLLDKCDELQHKIDELEESNMWKMLAILAISTLYTCVMIAVLDVKNNPEL